MYILALMNNTIFYNTKSIKINYTCVTVFRISLTNDCVNADTPME